MKKLFLLSVILLFLLSSCGDNSYLFYDQENRTLSTVYSGQWLSENDYIPLAVKENSELYDTDLLSLKLQKGENIYYEYEGSISGLPGFPIPSGLVDGEYTLFYEVFRNERLLSNQEIFFFIHSGNYGLEDIKLFPPLIREGEQILAKVNLVREDSMFHPWLIWKMGDQILHQGYLENQGGFVEFQVPDKTGVYPLEVEIFPEEPIVWTGTSPYKVSTEIFVTYGDSALSAPSRNDNYALYALFDDSMDIHHLRSSSVNLTLRDQYMLGDFHSRGIKGKLFRENSFIRFDGLALPVVDNHIVSHSQSFYFQLDESDNEKRETLLASSSPGVGTFFSINRIANQLIISLGRNNKFYRENILLSNDQIGRPLMLTVSFDIQGDQWSMKSYLDGQFMGSRSWVDSSHISTTQGETLLGSRSSTPGFSGALFSWMIYSQEIKGVDEQRDFYSQKNIFEEIKRLYWGNNLIMAEGFDHTDLVDSLTIDREPINILDSKCFLRKGDHLIYSGLFVEDGSYQIEIDGLYNETPLMELVNNNGFRIRIPYADSRIFKIEKRGIYLYLGEGQWEHISSVHPEYSSMLSLEITAQGSMSVDSLFIHR